MMLNPEMGKIHFPGLNSLRFFAALSVLIGHVELIKYYLDIPNSFKLFERINFGGMGVYFFFVLSGFLITYLLCAEKEKFETVKIKDFYIRRILRIWPLYFLIVALGFFILPRFDFFNLFPASFNQNFYSNLGFYLLILPNVAFSLFTPVAHISQSWSIGVEEQFYLFWPFLVKYSKNIKRAFIIVLILWISIKGFIFLLPLFHQTGGTYLWIKKLVAMSKFECMIIGSLGGVILFYNHKVLLKLIFHPVIFFLSLIAAPVLSYTANHDNFFQDVVHLPVSALFIIVILNIAANPFSPLKAENKFVDFLGKISYGIYMYHLIVIFLLVKLFKPLIITDPLLANGLVYSLSVVVSCLVSYFSYTFFEKYFIVKKVKFSRIVSG